MRRLFPFLKPRPPASTAARPPHPKSRFLSAALSLFALASLCFVLGAAAMHFNLPTSGWLRRAFLGAEDWFVSQPPDPMSGGLARAVVTADNPKTTFDGFTLYTTSEAAEAVLIDMGGRAVHRWKMPARLTWPAAPGVRQPLPEDPVHWERCHLYPNGDLLALCCAGNGSPYGHGLAKFDRDSRLLWAYSANAHHAFDVAEDGRIYALVQKPSVAAPSGLDSIPANYIGEELVILSPEGKQLDAIPILEAFRDSPYFLTLLRANEAVPPGLLAAPGAPGVPPPGIAPPEGPGAPPGVPPPDPAPPKGPVPFPPLLFGHGSAHRDVMHANSVKVLSKALASKFPQFKAGQVLLSFRTPSALAVLDTRTRTVVWAARGIWHAQHDATFLDNGNLLLFDNLGWARGSRALEYNPTTQAIPWCYADGPSRLITSVFRGGAQRLANGNTLIVSSDKGRIVEVSQGEEAVWQWQYPIPEAATAKRVVPSVPAARRFAPVELPFLKGTAHARPQ